MANVDPQPDRGVRAVNTVVNEAAIAELARTIGGGLEMDLIRVAQAIVVPIAEESLGDANELGEDPETGFATWGLNPPPGPPLMRSEVLQNSIHVNPPELDVAGIVCVPVSTYAVAERRSGLWRYDLILRDGEDGRGRGPYHFIPESPQFIYREYPATVSYMA